VETKGETENNYAALSHAFGKCGKGVEKKWGSGKAATTTPKISKVFSPHSEHLNSHMLTEKQKMCCF